MIVTIKLAYIYRERGLELSCFKPLSTMLQLYRGRGGNGEHSRSVTSR